jgi:hypothetical protein
MGLLATMESRSLPAAFMAYSSTPRTKAVFSETPENFY